jgi:hypothetical protein
MIFPQFLKMPVGVQITVEKFSDECAKKSDLPRRGISDDLGLKPLTGSM